MPTGWARDVRIQVDSSGIITGIQAGAAKGKCAVLSGAVLPGMPNVHSHAFQRALAGRLERVTSEHESFWTWRTGMYDLALRLTPDDVQNIAEYLYIEMLEAGYTSVGEFHYLHNDRDGTPYATRTEMADRLLTAAHDAGIGMTLLLVSYRRADFGTDVPSPMHRRFVTGVEDIAAMYRALASRTRTKANVRVGIAPHSLRTVGATDLRELLEAFGREAVPIHIHVAEQEREVRACIEHNGSPPVAWLLANAPVSSSWTLVHATHVTAEELSALAGSGATAGLCPTTEANLGDGIFPIDAFLRDRGSFGIGSDSHVAVDPAQELRLLEYAQRLIHLRRGVLAAEGSASVAETLYTRAARGGATSLGFRGGTIEVGSCADFVSLDLSEPLLAGCPPALLLDVWLFAGCRGFVHDVVVAGRQVVAKGRHPKRQSAARAFAQTMERLFA